MNAYEIARFRLALETAAQILGCVLECIVFFAIVAVTI